MDGEEGEGGKTGRGRPAKVKRAGGRPAVTGMCDVWLRGTWTEGATATRENMAALARAREDAAAAARWKAKAEAEKARAERAEERRRALLWETHASERGTRHALVEASELVSSAQRAAADATRRRNWEQGAKRRATASAEELRQELEEQDEELRAIRAEAGKLDEARRAQAKLQKRLDEKVETWPCLT